jgi:amino acid efflux transporter
MKESANKLSLIEGVSIGIGSIIGSGVLFLPSMTINQSGNDALLGWVLIILICIPGLFFLIEMVDEDTNEGVAGFVSKGLGVHIGNTIPVLLLGTVTIGMPSSAIVVGKYVQHALPQYNYIDIFIPYLMLLVAIGTSLFGLKTSAFLNSAIAFMLLAVGVLIFTFSFKEIVDVKVPRFNFNYSKILNTSVLAFWAFAGFENLTFLSKSFQKPKRDLLISASVAIVTCGLIYIGLTFNILMLLKPEQISSTIGLMQLAEHIKPQNISTSLVASFSFFAVMMNLISWTAGVSNAMQTSSEKAILPVRLGKTINGIPVYCIVLLGVIFLISVSFGIFFPKNFDTMVSTVSCNFLILYLLMLVSYFKYTDQLYKKIISLFLSICLVIVISSHGMLLIYPLALIGLTYAYSKYQKKP